MPYFDVPVVLRIKANDYHSAEETVLNWVDSIPALPAQFDRLCLMSPNFCHRDMVNNRVIVLHDNNNPAPSEFPLHDSKSSSIKG